EDLGGGPPGGEPPGEGLPARHLHHLPLAPEIVREEVGPLPPPGVDLAEGGLEDLLLEVVEGLQLLLEGRSDPMEEEGLLAAALVHNLGAGPRLVKDRPLGPPLGQDLLPIL